MNEKGILIPESERTEFEKFIINMNDELVRYIELINKVDNLKNRLNLEPSDSTKVLGETEAASSDIIGKLKNIHYLIEKNNDKFESLLIKINKIV